MRYIVTTYSILGLFLFFSIKLHSQTAFTCQGQFFVSLSSNNTTNLNQIDVDPITNNVTFTNLGTTFFTYNGIGYRSTDNFIYGMHPDNENFFRINPNGNATQLTNLNTINTNERYFAADITPNGDFYVATGALQQAFGGQPTVSLITVDMVNPGWATTQIPLTLQSTGNVNTIARLADIAFDPITGILYSFDNINTKIVTIDMNTGVMDDVSLPPAPGVNFLSSLFFDVAGNLWGYGSTNGNTANDLFILNKNTGAATYVTSGPSASGTDGCSCPYTVKLLKDVSSNTVQQCGTFQYTFTLINTSGTTQTLDLSDNMPADFTFSGVVSNPFGGVVTGLGTNQIDITGMTVPLGTNSIVVDVQVSNTATLGVYDNQASISGLPLSLGSVAVSDNPNTLTLNDVTPITVQKGVDLGPDIVACQGTAVTLDAGPSNGQYIWNNTSTSQTAVALTAGDYWVIVTENGCSVSDTVNVAFQDVVVDLGDDTTICTGDNLILDATQPNVTYQWSDNSTNPTLSVSIPGIYAVTVTDPLGCTDTDDVIVSNHPTVDLGTDEIFICDSSTFTLIPSITQSTYVWQDGSNNSTYVATTTGTYYVTVTDVNGCVSNDSIALLPPVIPNVDFGNDTILCAGTTLTLAPMIANGVSYVWQDGSNNPTFTVTTPGTYYVTATNNNTCSGADTIVVLYHTIIPNIGVDTMICHHDSLVLDATQPDMTYVWQNGSTNPTFTAQPPGTYFVVLTDTIGCTGTDTIIIGQHPITQVDLGQDLMYVCDSANSFTIFPNITTGGFLWQDGSTNTTFVADTFGFYDVLYTDANTCTSRDTIELFAPPIVDIDLGNDTILCIGDSIILVATIGNNRSYVWQDSSINDSLTIFSTGLYHVTATDNNGCQDVDTISVIFNEVIAVLRTDTTICFDATIPVDATQPDMTYLWSTGATTPTINVNQDTTYWVELTDTIGCTDRDTFVLSHHPVADLGDDVVFVCDSIFTPLKPGVTHGTFLWHDGSTDSIFIPTQQGVYWVEITDTNGCYSTDTVNLIPVTSPIVEIGNDTNICIGQTVIIDATTPFIRSYLWQDGTDPAMYNAISTGLYTVEVTDSNGCKDADSMMVWVNEVIPDIGEDTAICDGSQLLLNATQPNMTYLWQDGSTNPTFFANAGLSIVQLTDTLGCIGLDSIQIDYRPVADLANDTTLVCDSLFNGLTLTANIPNGQYQWSDFSIGNTLNVTSDGVYWLNITDEKGCFSSDTMQVFQQSYPITEIGNDTTICIGNNVLLDATIPNDRSYLWSDNSTNATLNVVAIGTYIVTVTDNNGCLDTDTITVTVNDVEVDLGNDTTICHSASITFDVTQPNVSYLWQDGSTSPIYTATTAGTFKVILTDGTSCSDSSEIIISHFPVIDLGPDRLFKCDSTEMTIYGNLNNGTYLWSDGSTTNPLIVTTPGTYSVDFVDNNNCLSQDTIESIAPPIPPINLGNDTVLCFEATHTLDAFASVGRSYVWHDGSTAPTFLVFESGTYFAEITDTNGCTNADTIMVDYFLPEALDLGNDTTICEATSLFLAPNTPNIVSYLWQDGSTGATFEAFDVGTYFVELTDVNNCTISDTINVDILLEPRPVDLPLDTTVCNYDEFTLNAFEPNATEYTWQGESAFFGQNDRKDTSFTIRFPGLYQVNIANRCASVDQTIQVVHEDCSCTPYIPNVFTPNNDGQNDEFKPMANCPIENYQMMIFDRWGNKLFETTEFNVGWDGTSRGNIAPTGVYVWRIQYESTNERGVTESFNQTGDVTILR